MEQSIPQPIVKDIPISVSPEGTKRSEAEANARNKRIIELALAESALGLYVFAPILDGSDRPGGASYFQGEVEKPKKESKLPPAPPSVPETKLPPAPPPQKEKPSGPVKLITGVDIGIAAEHAQIGKRDEKTGIEERPATEISEAIMRSGAWKRQTEEKSEYIGKTAFVRRFIPRLWKHTIHIGATYGKEKTLKLKERQEMGLQVLDTDYDFRRKVTALAARRIAERQKGKFKWYDRNFWENVLIVENELDKEYLQIVKELANASFSPDSPEAQNLRKELKEFETADKERIAKEIKDKKKDADKQKAFDASEFLTDVRTLLILDHYEAARTAGRLSSDLGPEVIHAAAGEVKGVKKLQMTGEAQAYLINNVIKPLLENGLKRRDGNVDDAVLLRAIKAANEFQLSKEFGTWYKSQLESGNEEVVKSAKAMDASLSYGNTVVDYTIQVMLKHAVEATQHTDRMIDIDQWVDQIKSKPFEVSVGTLKAGPAEVMKEGFMQHLAGREIRREKVQAIFDAVINGGGPKPYPQRYEDAAVERANLLTKAVNVGKSEVAWGLTAGLAIYAGQRVAGWGSNLLAPLLGGSAVAGLVKGLQERSFFTREWEQHNIEEELGYKVLDEMKHDAKRRAEMENLRRHKRWMQKDLTDPMTDRLKRLEEAQKESYEKDKIDDLLRELIGLVSDTQARFEIMDERGIGLLTSSNPYSYETEKTNLDYSKCKAVLALEKYFQAYPDKLKQMNKDLGMAENTPFRNPQGNDGFLDKLAAEQRLILETGVGANLEYQKALGNVKIEEGQAIRARESVFHGARRMRMLGVGVATFGMGAGFGMAGRQITEWFGFGGGHAVKEAFDPNKIQELQGVKMRLPPGFEARGDKIVDTVRNNATILDLTGRTLRESGGNLEVEDATGAKVPVAEVMKNTGLASEGTGADLAGESFASGRGVETEMMGSVETKVPTGTHWKDIGGGNFDLIPDDTSNNIIILHSVKSLPDGQLGWNPKDPINARFMQQGGNTNLLNIPGKATIQEIDPTRKIPDAQWLNNLAGLQNKGDALDDPFKQYRFILDADQAGKKALKIYELLDNGSKVGPEVGHNLIYFDAAKKTFSFEAIQGNAIPEKLVKALEETGLVKRDDLYKAIRLDAADQVARLPSNLDQIYIDNKVADFSDNVRWLSHGGWAKPAGAVYGFESGENTYLAPMKDWQPFPMTEVVDGKPVFSLAHFLNAYEDAKVIDESHVQILSGPNAGKIMEINGEMGQKREGATWLKEAARVGKRVVFDSNPKNRIVMEAPEGFLNDLKAVKEGRGDLSRFFVEQRLDPLSNKGIIAQFKGNSIYNAFADPSESSKSFGDNAFMDASGNVRGWTHFMWTEKPGDYSTVYSFANTGPTEHFNNLTLHNPFGPGVKSIPGEDAKNIPQVLIDKIDTRTPLFNFSFNRITGGIDGGIPIIFPFWPRRPLEAHEAVKSAEMPAAISGRGPYTGSYATISTQTGQVKAKTEGKKEEVVTEEPKEKNEENTESEGAERDLPALPEEEKRRIYAEAQNEIAQLNPKNSDHLRQVAAQLYIPYHELLEKILRIQTIEKDPDKMRDLAEDIILMGKIDKEMTDEEKMKEKAEVDAEVFQSEAEIWDRPENAAIKRFSTAEEGSVEAVVLREYAAKLSQDYTHEAYLQMIRDVLLEINRRRTANRYSEADILHIIHYADKYEQKIRNLTGKKRAARKDILKKRYRKSFATSTG